MKTARNTAPLVLFLIAVALLALRFGWQWSLAVWLFAALAACAAWLPLCRRGAQRPSEICPTVSQTPPCTIPTSARVTFWITARMV